MPEKEIRCPNPECNKLYYLRQDGYIEEKKGNGKKHLYITAGVIYCECGEVFDFPGVLTTPKSCGI